MSYISNGSGGGGAPTGAAGGDLGSTYPNPTVVSVANVTTGLLAPARVSTVLDSQYSTATLTGDSTDQTILTYTVPGGTMRAGRGIRITVRWTNTGATSTVYRCKFGGTTLFGHTDTNANTKYGVWTIFNQPGVTNAQSAMATTSQGTANLALNPAIADAAIDTTANAIVLLSFNVANTVAITKYMWIIELVN